MQALRVRVRFTDETGPRSYEHRNTALTLTRAQKTIYEYLSHPVAIHILLRCISYLHGIAQEAALGCVGRDWHAP